MQSSFLYFLIFAPQMPKQGSVYTVVMADFLSEKYKVDYEAKIGDMRFVLDTGEKQLSQFVFSGTRPDWHKILTLMSL